VYCRHVLNNASMLCVEKDFSGVQIVCIVPMGHLGVMTSEKNSLPPGIYVDAESLHIAV